VHYLKLVVIIVAVGVLMGSLAGTWLGTYVTQLFGDFFHFPFLIFATSADLYLTGAALSVAAAVLGAIGALRQIVTLAPAVAMQPPAPPTYHKILPARFSLNRIISTPAIMMLRNVTRHPLRALFTALGMASATAILIVSMFVYDTMESLIDVTYFMADR